MSKVVGVPFHHPVKINTMVIIFPKRTGVHTVCNLYKILYNQPYGKDPETDLLGGIQ